MPRRHHGACLSLSLACLWGGAVAASETTLDLALVLAVDVSSSMAPAEQSLQRSGFIEAFRPRRSTRPSQGDPSAASPSPMSNGREPMSRPSSCRGP